MVFGKFNETFDGIKQTMYATISFLTYWVNNQKDCIYTFEKGIIVPVPNDILNDYDKLEIVRMVSVGGNLFVVGYVNDTRYKKTFCLTKGEMDDEIIMTILYKIIYELQRIFD